tara:strand:- start:1620 stop:2000 length:381 start_codon:yes stop_codon:yes gene_type:complete
MPNMDVNQHEKGKLERLQDVGLNEILIKIVCGTGSMAKKLTSMFKSKTLAKILGGMGVAVAVPLVLNAVYPQASPNVTKAIAGVSSYLLGGVETVIGTAIPMFLGPMIASRQQVQSGAGLTQGGTL